MYNIITERITHMKATKKQAEFIMNNLPSSMKDALTLEDYDAMFDKITELESLQASQVIGLMKRYNDKTWSGVYSEGTEIREQYMKLLTEYGIL